jgi:hypothetical protein
MRAFVALALAASTLAACDLPPPPEQHAASRQDAPLGTRIRSSTATSEAVVGTSDASVLQKFQRSDTTAVPNSGG